VAALSLSRTDPALNPCVVYRRGRRGCGASAPGPNPHPMPDKGVRMHGTAHNSQNHQRGDTACRIYRYAVTARRGARIAVPQAGVLATPKRLRGAPPRWVSGAPLAVNSAREVWREDAGHDAAGVCQLSRMLVVIVHARHATPCDCESCESRRIDSQPLRLEHGARSLDLVKHSRVTLTPP
jgi:hypothetical protein